MSKPQRVSTRDYAERIGQEFGGIEDKEMLCAAAIDGMALSPSRDGLPSLVAGRVIAFSMYRGVHEALDVASPPERRLVSVDHPPEALPDFLQRLELSSGKITIGRLALVSAREGLFGMLHHTHKELGRRYGISHTEVQNRVRETLQLQGLGEILGLGSLDPERKRLSERDFAIAYRRLHGEGLSSIAADYDMTRQNVSAIVRKARAIVSTNPDMYPQLKGLLGI